MSRTLVFAGPTLSSEQIHAIAPAVDVYPPVASGELLRLPLASGDLVAIIDGFYFQSGAVRHKEILALMQRGIHVWGAASMGALRAAELAPFGMRGFGRIYEAYVQGEIEGDDEVAVLHSSEEMGNIHLTEALVNIRYACQSAVKANILSFEECELIIHTASVLPFFERSYAHILHDAREQGLPEKSEHLFRNYLVQEAPNLKRQDALELIEALRTPPEEPYEPPIAMPQTTFVRDWSIFHKGTAIDEKVVISDVDMMTVCQLFSEEYPSLHYNVLLNALANVAYRELHAQPRIEKQKDVDDVQHNWFADEASATDIVARYIAQQCSLRLDEELPASFLKWLRPEERQLSCTQQLALLGVRLWQEPRSLSWHKLMIDYLKASNKCSSFINVVLQAHAFNEVIQDQ
ncbi:MAG TPA: hypothetical protein DHW02_00055, partial [Ktedonobacter sp.]|nr:hypothetical protein [Ktedonobacter sp.]